MLRMYRASATALDARRQEGEWVGGWVLPRTDVMMPTQGFSPGRLGRRTRSLGRGGRRGGASFVLAPLGGIGGLG